MKKDNIQSLQVLRGIAALAVVIHHAIRAVTINSGDLVFSSPWFIDNHTIMDIGSAGVDIFFILSGFLMFYISSQYTKTSFSLITFLKHRFTRVWPLYVIVTMLVCSILFIQFIKHGHLSFDLQFYRLASIFFIPSFNESGLLQPILGVGWTLNYEVLFYIVFAVSLKINTSNPLPYVGLILCALFCIGNIAPEKTVVHAFFSNSIIFEFIFGALIGYAYKNSYLSFRFTWYTVAIGVIVIFISSVWSVTDSLRFVTTGFGAALVFFGMLTMKADVKFPRALVILGDASYSIYLIHILFIYEVCFRVLDRIPETILSNVNAEVIASIMIVGSVIAGLGFYYTIEKPLLNWFKNNK